MREASGIKDQWEELRGIQTKVAERWDDTTGIKSRDLSIEDLETLGTMLSDTQYDGQSFEEMVDQIQNVQDTSRLTLENMQKVVTDTTASLSTLQTATSEASSATGLTADTITSMGGMFSDIDNFDSAALFKNTANGVKLNTKALSSLCKITP